MVIVILICSKLIKYAGNLTGSHIFLHGLLADAGA